MRKKLLKSTLILSAVTVVSKVTGLLRDIVFAYYFGAGAQMDVFNVAYRIPNFIAVLFGEGVFSQALVPILSEYRRNRTREEIKQFLRKMMGNIFLVVAMVVLIAVVLSPLIVKIFAPGFTKDYDSFKLTVTMLRIMLPCIVCLSFVAFSSSILNAHDQFGIPAFTPIILNLSLIGGAVLISPYFLQPIVALAWGVLLGGIFQFLFQLPFLKHLGLLVKPQILWWDDEVKKVLKLMLPAILGVSVVQLNFLINNFLASFLPKGSITWLSYANRLVSFPAGLFGVTMATVLLPYLSRKYAERSVEEFSKVLDQALKLLLTIAIPATIGLMLLAGPVVITIFWVKGGQFNNFDAFMVKKSLFVFALGIPAFMVTKLLASSFYSRQDISTPARIAIASLIINVGLALSLITWLKHVGLALASVMASSVNALGLFLIMRKKGIYIPSEGWGKFIIRIIFANIILAIFLIFLSPAMDVWFSFSKIISISYLGAICVGAIIGYLAVLRIIGVDIRNFILDKR